MTLDDQRRHDAIACNIALRLAALSLDEIRVVDQVLTGIERGRREYGPLETLADGRNWFDELASECRDSLFYLSAAVVAAKARREAEIDAESELSRPTPIEAALAELANSDLGGEP